MTSAIWIIERLWTDQMENDYNLALGYKPVGYVETEDKANAMIAAAGTREYKGTCWPLAYANNGKPVPELRAFRLERIDERKDE